MTTHYYFKNFILSFFSQEIVMTTLYYFKSIIITVISFLSRVYHLSCFLSFSKKRLLKRFLHLLLKSSSFSHILVGQPHSRCSTTRMGSYFRKAPYSTAGLFFLRSPLFYPKIYSSLIPPSNFYFFPKRFMMTRNSLARAVTNLCCPINNKFLTPQSYATRRMNYPDNQPKDALALTNNPFYRDSNTGQIKRHMEISRLECSLPDCKQKDCPVLCSPCISVKSIASATHGKPETSAGDVYVLDDDIDINGDKKPQNAVSFKKPHDTGLASEYKKGTDFINKGEKGTKRRKKIMDNENDH